MDCCKTENESLQDGSEACYDVQYGNRGNNKKAGEKSKGDKSDEDVLWKKT